MNRHNAAAPTVSPDMPRPFVDVVFLRALLPFVVPIALASGMLFRGFDSAQGAAAGSVINGLMLMTILLLQPPALSLWTRMRPLLLLAGCSAIWLLIVQAGIPVIPFADRPVAFAPDMFAPAFAGWFAGLYAFMIGALMATNRADESRMMNMLLFANCAVLLIGLLVRNLGGQEALDYWSLSRQGRFAGTVGNANVTAVVAGMMALLATGRILETVQDMARDRADRALIIGIVTHGAAWAVAVVALIATASRAPIVLTVVMIAVLTLRTFGKGRVNWRRWALYAAPALALAVIVARAELFQQRLGGTSGEWDARVGLWSHYWDVAMFSPFYGYGLGGFQSINLFTMPSIRFAEGAWIVNSPHSILLQLMMVGGIPYLLLMAALAGRVTRDVRRHYAVVSWSTRKWSVALAVLLAMLCATIDIVMDMTSAVTLVLFLTGVLWGRGMLASR